MTRSGGPDEYAVCTKYAPTIALTMSAARQMNVSHSKSLVLDARDDDLGERRHEAVDDAGGGDVEQRAHALALPDPQAAEHDRDDAEQDQDRDQLPRSRPARRSRTARRW